MSRFKWARYADKGYEVSTARDARFSAFNAMLPDGRSIEQHYQCDVKEYDPGGTNWRLGKGKPGRNPFVDLWTEYLNLWRQWAANNRFLMSYLAGVAVQPNHNWTLTDQFAKTEINQAHALSVILNESLPVLDGVEQCATITGVMGMPWFACDEIVSAEIYVEDWKFCPFCGKPLLHLALLGKGPK